MALRCAVPESVKAEIPRLAGKLFSRFSRRSCICPASPIDAASLPRIALNERLRLFLPDVESALVIITGARHASDRHLRGHC